MSRSVLLRALGPIVVLMICASPLAAQDFTHGDLYLVTSSLPDPGGGSRPGVLHIDPSTWATQYYSHGAGNLSGRPAFDPYRNRLVITLLGGGALLMDATGATTTLPTAGTTNPLVVAPTGDGRIYFNRTGPDTFGYYDASDVVHNLLDPSGIAVHANVGTTTIIYDEATNSLVTTDIQTSGVVTIRRHDLSNDGSQVLAVTTVTVDVSATTETAVGMNHGPGGEIFIKVDDNSNTTYGRMLLLDAATMGVSTFASSGYFGVGGEVAGAYSSRLGVAVVLDSLGDRLRTFAAGASGEGTIVLTGPVSGGGSGELATLLEVLNCAADLDGDGAVGGADLASLLAQWGGPGSADLNNDGVVDGADLAALLAAWGSC